MVVKFQSFYWTLLEEYFFHEPSVRESNWIILFSMTKYDISLHQGRAANETVR